MPKTKISEYSATANSNTDVASINIDEGCAPSGINNAIRAIMGHLKDFQSGTSNDPFTVGSSGSLTLSYGTANGVAYLNGSKVLTTGSALVFDGTNFGVGLASPGCKVDVLAASNTSLSPTVRVYSNNLAVNTAISYDGIQGSGDFYIGSTSNSPVIFKQSNTEQMRLTSTGLGIGTSSPTKKLDVRVTGTGNVGNFQSDNGPNVSFTGTETNGRTYQIGEGLVTAGSFSIYDTTGSAERLVINSSGNLGLGVTPSAWNTAYSQKAFQFGPVGSLMSLQASTTNNQTYVNSNAVNLSGGWTYMYSDYATQYRQYAGTHAWYNAASGTAGNSISFTQAMTLDASGNLLVGTTAAQLDGSSKMVVLNSSATVAEFTASSGTATQAVLRSWNTATSGDNLFQTFHTDAGATQRGSITYNRTAGLVAYNTTSDYRAKDISGPVNNSGALIDSVPVYMGTMKGAIQERPMFIAHEVPAYAHTGEKDAVDEDGNPVYQQMDASALIPVMWAEIQSLRKRLAAAGI